ncbi:DUF1853 family protein [Aquimarina spongiae]|uniref:DUF1853 domain-containing protein n=1 Tax=Aquimarina spongiae TaxID=570521 RepID=A0A1M6CM35_9FLAO|nr:DUF1853 family protein [Aquimarina spongiae]SHI62077.1 hypothetical protein SAMN04488508_102182 [Aquimarina spongiae]
MPLKEQYLSFLKTPVLWNNNGVFGIRSFHLDHNELDMSVPEPSEITFSENEVLGKRIEHFFNYYIKTSERYLLLLKNLQIFSDQITIGELDFIVQDLVKNKVIHIELVFKFYIYDPTFNDEMDRWIGPNRKDTFRQKIDKLRQKQLPLLFKKETIASLKELKLDPQDIDQSVCFMAHLFVPKSMIETFSTSFNLNCIIGYWIKDKEFSETTYGAHLFYIPQKKEWMVDPKYHSEWYSFTTTQKCVTEALQQKRSPLLWMKSGDQEFQRFFVVWW